MNESENKWIIRSTGPLRSYGSYGSTGHTDHTDLWIIVLRKQIFIFFNVGKLCSVYNDIIGVTTNNSIKLITFLNKLFMLFDDT